MSRNEARIFERHEDKFNKKFNKLNPTLKDLVIRLGEQMTEINIMRYMSILDRNISAAVILRDGNSKDAYEMTYLVGHLLGEDREKFEELEKQFMSEEECKMAVHKMHEEIKYEIKKLIEVGKTKKVIIDELVYKFPKLSKSMITNAYQNVKDEIDNEDSDVKEGVEKIMSIIEGEKGMDKNAQGNTEKGLKVLEEKVVKYKKLKGENGEYEAETGKGIYLKNNDSEIRFENEEQLDNWVSEIKQVFSMI